MPQKCALRIINKKGYIGVINSWFNSTDNFCNFYFDNCFVVCLLYDHNYVQTPVSIVMVVILNDGGVTGRRFLTK